MPLQFRLDTGNLIMRASGRLQSECCCPAPVSICNDCDPPLSETYIITISGLSGDFARYNGETIVSWCGTGVWSICVWSDNCSFTYPWIQLFWGSARWRIQITAKLNCGVGWIISPDPCDPTGTSSAFTCNNATGCDDPGSCIGSAGAIIIVSVPVP